MKRFLFLALLISLLNAGAARAQSSSGGTVRGVVKDEQDLPLPGVTINATSAAAPRGRTTVSESDGTYRLVDLPPGTWTIVAELSGFNKATVPGVEVRAGLNLAIDLRLTAGSISESVTVRAETPVLETQKAVQAVNIAGDFQRALPLTVRRDFTDFLEVTPGVTARSFISNNGTQVYMLRGTDVENHTVQIDGADIGSPRQSQPTFVHLSADAIADTQVKTAGADASAPIGLGVVLNVATKAATDQLRGSLGTSFQPRSWNANNNPRGIPTISDSFDGEVAAGGPFVRGRLWGFGSFRYLHQNRQVSRNPQQLSGFRAIDPNWQPFDNRTRGKYTFVKGTYQISPAHQMYVFYETDGTPDEGNQSTDFNRLSLQTQGGSAAASRLYSTWSDRLASTLVVAWNDKTNTRNFSDYDPYITQGPSIRIYDSTILSSGRLNGNGLLVTTGNLGTISRFPSSKVVVNGDLTWYKTGLGGSHELQTGINLQPRLYNSTIRRALNGGFTIEDERLVVAGDPSKGWVPFHRQYIDQQDDLKIAEVNSQDYAAYVQDSWKPTQRLTVAGGFRVDKVISRDLIFDVQTQDSWEFGPRLGVTWVLTANGRNVVHGSAARIAAKPENAFLPSLGGAVNVTTTDRYDTQGNGSFSAVFVTPGQTALAANRSIDPDRHQPFTDEYLIGYRAQLPGRLSFDAAYIQRNYMDLGAQIDVNAIYAGNQFLGYKDPTQNAILMATNNKWNHLVYQGTEISVAQRTSRSQLLLGYTRVWDHVAGTWQPGDIAAIIQPDAFPNDKGIGTIRGNENNSLSGTAQTRSPMWIPHTVRLSGSYDLRGGVTVASNYVFLTGPWTGPIITRVAAADPKFGPPTLTLSNGRVVSNPLATVLRFAYATRGEGQVHSPNLQTLNARVSRNFTLGTYRLNASFSVLNVLNAAADQEFLGGSVTTANSGSNQLYSPNFAYAPDGTFRGQNRQAARAAQVILRFEF